MTEAEKKLRNRVSVMVFEATTISRDRLHAEAMAALSTLLAEHQAEVARARDAALEEAEECVFATIDESRARIRALKSTPEQVVPVARVRDVCRPLRLAFSGLDIGSHGWSIVRDVLEQFERLGVPLDNEEDDVLALRSRVTRREGGE